jgi:hypothetical protein
MARNPGSPDIDSGADQTPTRLWKECWDEARDHFTAWWEHRGLVLTINGGEPVPARTEAPDPGPATSLDVRYTDADWRTRRNLAALARAPLLGDTLPIANTDIGPGSLALFIGSEPNFTESTVWYDPRPEEPDGYPTLRFDPANRWWKVHEDLLTALVRASDGRFLVGCPDLIENVDILVSLRGMGHVLTDMLDRPEWVETKVWEINQVFFKAYERVYEIIRQPDGSATFSAFHLWAPGKVAKVQCDASAAFSPTMFKRFVVPALRAQCEWLDYSMYHLDGTQAMCHLDLLLDIGPLDAIEWTPQHGIPGGGAPKWFEMYRRILNAGKSVQAIGVKPEEVVPLLDAVGPNGLYITTHCPTRTQAETLWKSVEGFR